MLCSETLATEQTISCGNNNSLNGIASCSAHGGRVVSASKDGSATVWDVATGEQIAKFSGHADALCCVAIASSGTTCVTGSMDCSLKTWDMATGEVHHELRGHVDWVYSCALTPDDRMIVSGSADRTLRVWDASNGKAVRKLIGHTGSVLCCAITDDGAIVLSGSRDNSAKVWDVVTGKSLFALSGHDDWVLSCAILKNDSVAATGSSDGTIRLWGLATGVAQKVLKGPGMMSWVNSLVSMDEGDSHHQQQQQQQLLSISEDKRLRVWDVETGDLIRSVKLPCVQKSAAISVKARISSEDDCDLEAVPVPVPVVSLLGTPGWDLRRRGMSRSCASSLLSVTPPGTPPRAVPHAATDGMLKLSFSSIATLSSQEESSASPTDDAAKKHCQELMAAAEPLKRHSLVSLLKKKLLGRMLAVRGNGNGTAAARAGKRTNKPYYGAAACWHPQQPTI